VGGIYLYANLMGCDGERVYYDGCAMIAMNGEIYARTPQFSMKEVEIASATLDLDDVRVYRGASASWSQQATASISYPRIQAIMNAPMRRASDRYSTSPVLMYKELGVEEEIALGPACWLWDYLRRSGASGFFLPLSGGSDSSSVAVIVHSMCGLLCDALNDDSIDSRETRDHIRRITKQDLPLLVDAKLLAK
jgi:NAD+ synthase (glutamine-hydrolysing)